VDGFERRGFAVEGVDGVDAVERSDIVRGEHRVDEVVLVAFMAAARSGVAVLRLSFRTAEPRGGRNRGFRARYPDVAGPRTSSNEILPIVPAVPRRYE